MWRCEQGVAFALADQLHKPLSVSETHQKPAHPSDLAIIERVKAHVSVAVAIYRNDILIRCPLGQAGPPNDIRQYCWIGDYHKAMSWDVQPAPKYAQSDQLPIGFMQGVAHGSVFLLL